MARLLSAESLNEGTRRGCLIIRDSGPVEIFDHPGLAAPRRSLEGHVTAKRGCIRRGDLTTTRRDDDETMPIHLGRVGDNDDSSVFP